jgi:hypothetical protein
MGRKCLRLFELCITGLNKRHQGTSNESKERGLVELIHRAPNIYPKAELIFGEPWSPRWAPNQIALDFGTELIDHEVWVDEEPAIVCRPQLAEAMPDARVWAQKLTLGIAECLTGIRSPQQLITLLDFHIYRAVVAQCPTSINRRGIRPNVMSVKTFTSGDETVEVCSVVKLGPRSRAFAMQLRARESKWRCSSLIVG